VVDRDSLPRIIFLAGVDGCGKTTLSRWLNEYLAAEGVNTRVIWSRFNNYLSKPLLALTRVTGHNYRKTIDGVKFGFHDFDNLYVYSRVFALLQAIDVNIAAARILCEKILLHGIIIWHRSGLDL